MYTLEAIKANLARRIGEAAEAAAVLGFQVITPVFDGATEAQIRSCLEEANAYVRHRRDDVDVVRSAGPTSELLTEMRIDHSTLPTYTHSTVAAIGSSASQATVSRKRGRFT